MTNKILKCFLAVFVVFTFVGCGSSGNTSEYTSGSNSYSYGYDADYAKEEALSESMAMDAYAPAAAGAAPAAMPTPSPVLSGSGESSSNRSEAEQIAVKLVYTGSITVETLEYENTMKSVREKIVQYKGIIEDEREWDGDHSWYYTDGRARTTNRNSTMTIRIPTKDFENFLNDMDGTGKVTSRSQNVENISRRYYDNSIEIEALEKQQERLLEMMDKAETVQEMIMIEERLTEVQTRLNQRKSYRSSMDMDVEYSTVYLNVNEVQKYTPVEDPGINIGGFGKRVIETLEYSGKFFVYVIQGLILSVIWIAPFALIIGLICFAVGKYRKSKGLHPNPFHREKKTKSDTTKIDVGTVKK